MTARSSYTPLHLASGDGWNLLFDLRFVPEPYVLCLGGRVWRFRTRRGADVAVAAWTKLIRPALVPTE